MRHAARTDANQTQISEALRAAGYPCWYIRWPVDLLVRTKRGWLPIEVKTRAGRLTDDQESFLRDAGDCPVAVVRDIESALRAVRDMECSD